MKSLWDIFGRSSSGERLRETSGTSLQVVELIVAERGDEAGEQPIGEATQCALVTVAARTHRQIERPTIRVAGHVRASPVADRIT